MYLLLWQGDEDSNVAILNYVVNYIQWMIGICTCLSKMNHVECVFV